jgi:uncharacterized protein
MKAKPYLSKASLSDAVHPRALHLILLPTEQCNFRCTYCYEDFDLGRMRPELVRGIKTLVDRRIDDLLAVSLSWFGGEPLAARDIVFDIAEHVQRRCQARGVTNLGGHLTTNGYLLDLATVERLCAAEQRTAQISLDGLGAVHDRSRPLASGRGSFQRIWDNLLAIRASGHDFRVSLRIHVGAAEEAETAELCREINCQFGGDPRFSAYLRLIANWGGANGDRIQSLSATAGRAAVTRLARLLTDIAHNGEDDGEQYICYAARPNTWLIRADGRVGRCTVALDDPRNTVGHLDESGRLRVDNDKLRPWLAGLAELDSDLLACPYGGVRRMPEAAAAPAAGVQAIALPPPWRGKGKLPTVTAVGPS